MNRRDALKTFATIPAFGLIPAVKGTPEPFFSVSNGVETLELKREDFKDEIFGYKDIITLNHAFVRNEIGLIVSPQPDLQEFWEANLFRRKSPLTVRCLGRNLEVTEGCLLHDSREPHPSLLAYIKGKIEPIRILDGQSSTIIDSRDPSLKEAGYESMQLTAHKDYDQIHICLFSQERDKEPPIRVSNNTLIECHGKRYHQATMTDIFPNHLKCRAHWIHAKSTI